MRRLIGAVVATLTLAGCGNDANFNKIWGNDDDAADVKFAKAKAAYDRGDFRASKDLLETLVERNPDNEDAVVLLGYVYLSTGGIDPFTLAKKLIEISTPTTSTTKKLTADDAKMLDEGSQAWAQALADATADDEQFMADAGTGSSASTTSSTTGTLQKLGTIINLTEADFAKLQLERKKDTIFEAAPIIVPKLVDETLRGSVDVLNYMNRAVMNTCRFVDESAKVSTDSRHKSAACTQTSVARNSSAKAHFLWAFSHLTEAMVFQSVLLYTSVSTGKTNFETVSESLSSTNASTPDEISAFVTKVTDLKTAVDAVFDVGTPDSMISATLRNVLAVSQAFKAMSGLPASMTKPITDSLSKIEELAAKFGAKTDVGSQTKALKSQMMEKISTTMNAKISTVLSKQIENLGLPAGTTITSKADFQALATSTVLTDKQKADAAAAQTTLYGDTAKGTKGICGAYESLSTGLASGTTTTDSTPAPCKS